ncbi:uncharacterized protein BKA55DRAFT_584720 [Fusarium redolens]|uniref:Uncharacterized protein n=1 Tax=Fusarium redolens TaxID=48865 RepID=A0A9P9JLB3_FUSRE|nr:uncharacterized protein BKA55DRAFT_584720 [Fusarium redolens]KAH7222603.1 hypothetical protein BKA55DRAFT_584720 [Fusarium redolens]
MPCFGCWFRVILTASARLNKVSNPFPKSLRILQSVITYKMDLISRISGHDTSLGTSVFSLISTKRNLQRRSGSGVI